MNREEQGKKMAQLIAKCWSDEDFKKELLSNPSAVFKDNGIDIPEGIEVKVVEDTGTTVHFILPPKPAEGELSDEDLDGVAGGYCWKMKWPGNERKRETWQGRDLRWKSY